MAKGQKRSNKEAKKPKQVKAAPAAAGEGIVAKAGGAAGTGKKRP